MRPAKLEGKPEDRGTRVRASGSRWWIGTSGILAALAVMLACPSSSFAQECQLGGGCPGNWDVDTSGVCSDGAPCTTDCIQGDPNGSHWCFWCTTCANDNNACNGWQQCNITTGVCDLNTVSCPEGEVCTSSSVAAYSCVECLGSGDCADGDDCTEDTCNPDNTCSHQLLIGAACNDPWLCTVGDTCDVNGDCVGTPTICDDTRGGCRLGACNTLTGSCDYSNVIDGAGCDDGDVCTDSETCTGGVCFGVETGKCVELEWRNYPTMASVGETIEVDLYAKSGLSSGVEIDEIEAVLNWDPTILSLKGRQDPCADTNVCFVCPTSFEYNWVLSFFPNDSDLDGLNADCGPDTFCSPWTGFPYNDGTAYYDAIRQVQCTETVPLPLVTDLGLHVTTFQFDVIGAGTVDVAIAAQAECELYEKTCVRGEPGFLGDLCTDDTDCVGSGRCLGGTNPGDLCNFDGMCFGGGVCRWRKCLGGTKHGQMCAVNGDCPGGFCPAYCTACSASACCTSDSIDEACSVCAFKETSVYSGESGLGGENILSGIGPPATISASDCDPPVVEAIGPRYFAITPAEGPPEVAIFFEGADFDVACVSGYVRGDGTVGSNPVYKPPSGQGGWNTVLVRGETLVANMTYSIRTDCDSSNPGTSRSDPVSGKLWMRGDTNNTGGDVDILDIIQILDAFQHFYISGFLCTTDAECQDVLPHRECVVAAGKCRWVSDENADNIGDLGCTPDRIVGILDAIVALEEFQHFVDRCGYPCQ